MQLEAVGDGTRRWRRAAQGEQDAEAEAAALAPKGASSWRTLLQATEGAASQGDDTFDSGGDDGGSDAGGEDGGSGAGSEERGDAGGEVELPEPKLHGPTAQRLSSAGLIPSHDKVWFNDAVLANCNAADGRPEGGVPLRYNFPKGFVNAAHGTFTQRGGQRTLNKCDCVLLQQFCDGVHWHNLALIGPQKLAVHWEPMGSDIHARASPVAAVRRAFESAPKADGWRLVSVRMDVQSDGYQCGPWAHWFRGRLYEYCSSAEAMAGGSFEDFLRASEGVRALDGLKGRAARAEAGEANTLLMHEERVRLRALLRAAARQGKLPWEDAKGLAFVPEGATRGEEEDLAEHDEMLEGDDEFHPIVLER